jgi:hypothetical protein
VSIDLSGMDAGLTPKTLVVIHRDPSPSAQDASLGFRASDGLKKTTAKGCWWSFAEILRLRLRTRLWRFRARD